VLHHPGILNSQAQLDSLKANVKANLQPWKNAYTQLAASNYSSLNYADKAYDTVACGSYNKPNIDCTQIVDDGMAVYSLSLMWAITNDQRYAAKAIQIISDWSSLYVTNTNSNARLVVAWAAPWFANGAEILRYYNAGAVSSGWTAAGIQQFIGMLNKFLPFVEDNTAPMNNWMQSRIEAQMAIAVFKDDQAELNSAIARWKSWLPIYIYESSDGNAPVNGPGYSTAQTLSIWKSTSTGTRFVNGMAMETCRDLGHLGLGFGSMMYAAETAYQQGTDFFADGGTKKRLADFVEVHGSWMLGLTAVPDSICGGVVLAGENAAAGISPPSGGGQKVWEIAYDHLALQHGVSLPNTKAMILKNRPVGAAHWVQKWETLTAGENLSSSVTPISSSVVASSSIAKLSSSSVTPISSSSSAPATTNLRGLDVALNSNAIVKYQIFDMMGHLQTTNPCQPMLLPRGRWIVVGVDLQGHRVATWLRASE
jgi:hypothetical protein